MKRLTIILLLIVQAVVCNAQSRWVAEIELPQMGKYQFFTTQTIFSDNHFVLKSVENRDKLFLGSFKAKLLRLAQKRKYKKSICAIEINGNSGVVYSLFGTFALDSIVLNNSTINAKLIFDENENKGNFVAKKLDENRQKLNDYQLIFSNIQSETEKEIFNPELTKSQKWKKFVKQTNSKIEKVDDDLDFLLLFFANARNTGFSHFAVMKENIDLERTLQGSQLESNMLNDSVLYIKINSLSGTIFEIDSVFQQAQQYKYKIMDFRGTPGGVIKNAYRIASYLIPDTVEGGIFITRKCYDDNDCIKNPLACDKLVDYDINTDFNVFRNCAGVRVRLIPNKNIPYNPEQKIYILTDNKTASACEPLIYGLRQQKNITIVGEKTAGAILSPIVFDVGGGYYAIIPVAEYLTADGKQIEGKGIEPDVKVKSKKALETVKQLLN